MPACTTTWPKNALIAVVNPTKALVAGCLGLRISEVMGLQWGDLDLDSGTAFIQRSVVSGRTEPEGFASGDQNKESQARPSANTTHRRPISA
jgi:integrase